MAKAKFEDAQLLLQLYELRREPLLRKARMWFLTQFSAYNWEEYQRKYPRGSEEERLSRMVTSYWNMVASIVLSGAINEILFYQSNGELLQVWNKVKPWVEGARMEVRPNYLRILEAVAKDYQVWADKQAAKYTPKLRRGKPEVVPPPVQPVVEVKRKRGRPPKPKPEKRGRGRPRGK